MTTRHGIDWQKAQALFAEEQQLFVSRMPKSRELSQRAARHQLFGVPMHWMRDWSTPFALYVAEARGARFKDVDGHDYVDFCLGDTGAMFGHSPQPVADAIMRQAQRGYTAMLPNEHGVWVAEELARRFGLPYWQWALSASDANRFAIRWARAITRRQQVLIFNGCYHGTVDDVFVDLVDGQPQTRDSVLGQVYDITQYTRSIEFNDLAALEAALKDGEVACLLAEPAMTNIGMVLPQPGYWAAAQALCRRYGTLLLIDETHTISSGPGGYTQAEGLQPDIFVVGKPVAGGVPCAVYGFSAEVARRAEAAKAEAPPGHSGIGTTLTANLLAMAAMRANLAEVMTDIAYQHMFGLAERLAAGLRDIIRRQSLPWCVTQIGARVEFQFTPVPPKNGSEAGQILDGELEHIVHLYLLNRGLLITPFHNMLLLCPDTRQSDVDRLLQCFGEFVGKVRQA